MENVTITLSDELARWLRVRAAEDDRSVPMGGRAPGGDAPPRGQVRRRHDSVPLHNN